MASALATWACGGAGAFACTDDPQCATAGELGRCEASGYCSFADDACPSGRRYGARAPGDLAEECVPPGDATSVAESADDVADDGDPTSAVTTDATTSTTSVTTTPVDPSTSGEGTTTSDSSPPETSDAGPLDDGTSTTAPAGPPCEPAFVDDFEDGLIDPQWETWSSPECWFAEQNGHLELVIAPSDIEWVSAGLYTQPGPLLGGHVRAELVPFTAPLDVVGVWLTIFDAEDCEIQIAAENSTIHGHSAGVWFDPVQVDTEQPLWLQLRVDPDGFVHWEWSSDGEDWDEVHGEAPPCDFTSAHSALFAGDMHGEAGLITRAVESYERCEAP